ncbi:MAG: class I SAM-dependent methyltransferase [Planctomycetota bacterium]
MQKRGPTPSPLYESDLAEIHVEGYGFHWERASGQLLTWLEEHRVPKPGLVIDLGCGGGQWLSTLIREGYRGHGIDVSPRMIRIAEKNAPEAGFSCDSFDTAAIPACAAVTSLGEPLNYLASGAAIRRTLRTVFAALALGGVFIFDVRHPAVGRVEPRYHHKAGRDWFCCVSIEEDHRTNRLTRHITTFRRQEDGDYRRNEETHRLRVFSIAQMSAWLREAGFRVRTRRGYGDYRLGPRQSVFIATKPRA